MVMNQTDVPTFPKINAIVRANGTAEVVVAGNSRNVRAAESVQQLRDNALSLVVREAKTLNRPVRVQVNDPEGQGELIVNPDGTKESVSYVAKASRRRVAEAPDPAAAPPTPAAAETIPAPIKDEPITDVPGTVPSATGTSMTLTPETTATPEAQEWEVLPRGRELLPRGGVRLWPRS